MIILSVKKKDRHLSKSDCLGKTRALIIYLVSTTKQEERDEQGKVIRKGGVLGVGQPYYAYGKDLFDYSKHIYELSHKALDIYIKDEETYRKRKILLDEAIGDCKSMLRLLDLAIFQYKDISKKKIKTLHHTSLLIHETKQSLHDRVNRDGMIINKIQHRNNGC